MINISGWTVILGIVHNRSSICNVKTENIYLRIPVQLFNGQHVRDMRIVNQPMTWYIHSKGGRKYLRINDQLHMFAMDENGRRTGDDWMTVNEDITNLVWGYLPLPIAFDKCKNYGQAIVSIARDFVSVASASSSNKATKV